MSDEKFNDKIFKFSIGKDYLTGQLILELNW